MSAFQNFIEISSSENWETILSHPLVELFLVIWAKAFMLLFALAIKNHMDRYSLNFNIYNFLCATRNAFFMSLRDGNRNRTKRVERNFHILCSKTGFFSLFSFYSIVRVLTRKWYFLLQKEFLRVRSLIQSVFDSRQVQQ